MPKKYVRVKDRRVGVAVKERKQISERNANQWVVTPKQMKFVEYWLDTKSPTYSNAYQSAIRAGYSTNHAKQITSNVLSLEWVKEAKRRLRYFTPDHTLQLLQDHAMNAKDSDSLRALELIGKIQGLFIDRSIHQIDVQFKNEVPRPVRATQRRSKARSDDGMIDSTYQPE